MPEISVIVPVYNVEKYLKQCLDSILTQTFYDFEVICVNDGSTDLSREILKDYEKKDNRIKVIEIKHSGLSEARNEGLKIAKGNFISFIDSDDWVKTDILEKLYNNIQKSDISMCGVCLFDEKTQKIVEDRYFDLSVFPKNFDNKIFNFYDTKNFLMEVPVMAWNKLYRHDFLKRWEAKFPEGKIFEDGAFFFSIYFKTTKVSLIREQLYFYRINRKNSILDKGGEKFSDIIDIVNLMFEELKQTSIFEEVKYDFYKRKAEDVIYRYKLLDEKLKPKFSKKLKKEACLFDEKYFDFNFLSEKEPVIYKILIEIKHKTSLFAYYRYKFNLRLKKKIIQILNSEENYYYFKFWDLKFRIKKCKKIFNAWYENDKINVILFSKIKLKKRVPIE